MSRFEEVLAKLQPLVRPALLSFPSGEAIPADAALVELGMSSTKAIQMVVDVEREFHIEFPDQMLNEDTFRNLRNLAEAVLRLEPGPPPP